MVQLPSAIDDVTPSPYTTLKRISSVLHVVSPKKMTALAREAGFDVEAERVVAESGGKTFRVSAFRVTVP